MEIKRINTYDDERFTIDTLKQHGCFLIEDKPYEVKIISSFEAIIKGENREYFLPLIEEFRFYSPHITRFYDLDKNIIKEYPKMKILKINIEDIQPSQFYVDLDKVSMIKDFIHENKDIIIQVMPYFKKYAALDGHTRLYLAILNGWKYVYAVEASVDDSIYDFINEAKRMGITNPSILIPLSHSEYEIRWNKYCDEYFSSKE